MVNLDEASEWRGASQRKWIRHRSNVATCALNLQLTMASEARLSSRVASTCLQHLLHPLPHEPSARGDNTSRDDGSGLTRLWTAWEQVRIWRVCTAPCTIAIDDDDGPGPTRRTIQCLLHNQTQLSLDSSNYSDTRPIPY